MRNEMESPPEGGQAAPGGSEFTPKPESINKPPEDQDKFEFNLDDKMAEFRSIQDPKEITARRKEVLTAYELGIIDLVIAERLIAALRRKK